MAFAVLLGCVIAGSTRAADGDAVAAADSSAMTVVRSERARDEVAAAEWVGKLGDRRFSVRRQAARELEAMGLASKSELLAALSNSDAEIRFSAQRILVDVLEADFQARLDAFIADETGHGHYDLPCWKFFSSAVGNTPAARELFAEALRAEPVLMETAEQEPRRVGEAVAARCDVLLSRIARDRAQQHRSNEGSAVPLGQMTALLITLSRPEVPQDEASGFRVYQLFHQSRITSEINRVPGGEPIRRLVGAWVKRNADSPLSFQCMWLGMRYDLKEGLAPAEVLLDREDQQPYVRQLAILAIAKLGTREHVVKLEPFLTNTAFCGPVRQGSAVHRCEVRDVALAAIIHLHGKNPKDFGFDKLIVNPQTLFVQNSMGFLDEKHRMAALARWKEYLAEQAKPSRPGARTTAAAQAPPVAPAAAPAARK